MPILEGGTPTGKSIQSTAVELKIDWATKDKKSSIFSDVIKLDPGSLTLRDAGDVTDEKARQLVFAMLKIRLPGLPMPYFVPIDKSLTALPIQTSSAMAAPVSEGDALKAKIEAKKKKIAK